MKISTKKLEIEMARRCMSVSDLVAGGVKKASYDRLRQKKTGRTETIGLIAKTIGCDVTDILADD